MSAVEADEDWLFDYIVAFLRSPPWTFPINTFIDQHCIVFDGEEENKMVHFELHQVSCRGQILHNMHLSYAVHSGTLAIQGEALY